MRPIPLQWLSAVAWFVFIELMLMVVWMWALVYQGAIEEVLGLGFSFLAFMSFPKLKMGGWGVLKGWNLCRNRSTFLVAVGVYALFVVSFWMAAFGDHVFDELSAIGTVIPGLMLVRAYTDTVNKMEEQS